MAFLVVGHGGLVLAGGAEHGNLAREALLFGNAGNATGGYNHRAVAGGAAEACVEEDGGRAELHAAEVAVDRGQGHAHVLVDAGGIDGNEIGVEGGVVGRAVAGVVDDYLHVLAHDVVDEAEVGEGGFHGAVGGVVELEDVLFGDAEGALAVEGKCVAVVEGIGHVGELAVVLVGDDYGKGVVVVLAGEGDVEVNVAGLNLGGRGDGLGLYVAARGVAVFGSEFFLAVPVFLDCCTVETVFSEGRGGDVGGEVGELGQEFAALEGILADGLDRLGEAGGGHVLTSGEGAVADYLDAYGQLDLNEGLAVHEGILGNGLGAEGDADFGEVLAVEERVLADVGERAWKFGHDEVGTVAAEVVGDGGDAFLHDELFNAVFAERTVFAVVLHRAGALDGEDAVAEFPADVFAGLSGGRPDGGSAQSNQQR